MMKTFKEWFLENYVHGLFKGRYECKDDPDGNKGNWSKVELRKKYDEAIQSTRGSRNRRK
jgi:hypothetical protein